MKKKTLKKLNAMMVALAFVGGTTAFAMTPAPASSMMFGNCANPSLCEEHTGGMEVCAGQCPSPTSICCAPE